jgi:hypothetical protein
VGRTDLAPGRCAADVGVDLRLGGVQGEWVAELDRRATEPYLAAGRSATNHITATRTAAAVNAWCFSLAMSRSPFYEAEIKTTTPARAEVLM